MAKIPDTEKTVLEDTGTMEFTDFFEDAITEAILRDKQIKKLQEENAQLKEELIDATDFKNSYYHDLKELKKELAEKDKKIAELEEELINATDFYAKKYFDLWKEMFGEELRDE